MNTSKFLLLFILSVIFQSTFAQENKEIVLKSEVSDVTVFIDGAQVTRSKTTDILPGKTRIRFTNLSPYIDPKSVQVKVNGEVMVTSVNHQMNYIDSAKFAKPKDPNKRILEIADQLEMESTNRDIIKDELDFLDQNKKIGGNNSGVSLLTLKETANYYRERVTALKTKEAQILKNIQKLKDEREAIINNDRQDGILPNTKPASIGEIIVDVESKKSVRPTIEVSYYVKNAGWYPTYDIRATSIDQPIELLYKANIRQNTKEDWKNVKLKISSSNPTLGNVAPELKTYFLNYNTKAPRYDLLTTINEISGVVTDESNEPVVGATIQVAGTTIGTVTDVDGRFTLAKPQNAESIKVSYLGFISQNVMISNSFMNIRLKEDNSQLEEVVVEGYGSKNRNVLGAMTESKIAGLAVTSPKSAFARQDIAMPTTQQETQTAVEFDINIPYSIKSDNKNTMVEVDRYLLPAKYEYLTVPKVNKDAFLIANIVDWEKYNLLEAEANVFFENRYIGKTIIDVRNISDTLNISLGRDKSVLVKRENIKEYSTKKFFGNKKEDSRAWRISVRNNKNQPIDIVVVDQIPVSTNQEIEVVAEDTSKGEVNAENGEVKWRLSLKPADKKEFDLKYKVKYPKSRSLIIE